MYAVITAVCTAKSDLRTASDAHKIVVVPVNNHK